MSKSVKNVYGFMIYADDGITKRMYRNGHTIAEIFRYADQVVKACGYSWIDIEVYILDQDEEIIR